MMLGRIAQYELLEKIGEGGMGVVFKARDSRLDKVVALKILLDEFARDAEYRARFLREARAEAGLNHPAIAMCFDVGEARLVPPDLLRPGAPGPHTERVLYLTMEYVPGSDLMGLVGDRPLAIPKVLDLTLQIAAGLESAHGAGVIHRDLKSSNVRVTPDGRVKIIDFGLSRMSRPKREDETATFTTSASRRMGTVHYMAPEQGRGRTTDPRSDLFSLGVIAYQLVTGKLPFTGSTDLEVGNAVANEEPPPLARYASGVPDELERVVRKLIAKDPEQRYQSAHEVRTDIERLQLGAVRRRRRPIASLLRAFGVGTGALATVLAMWWAWNRWGPQPVRTIAVMPFENRTGNPRLDYLGEGIAAGVLGDLVRSTRFDVASLSSTQSLERDRRSAKDAARELGVETVLLGSLRQQDGTLHIDIELVKGHSGYVLLAESHPYALQNLLNIQREIARQVVRKIARWTPAAWAAEIKTATPRSPSAYDRYLRAGSALDDVGNSEGPEQALEFYAQALQLDPDFALAWAGRSFALMKIWRRDKQEESVRLAEEAANRAIRLQPELLEARVARAQIYRATGRYAESIRELQDVLQVNPNWDEAIVQLSASYREAGDLAKAEANLRRAISLRPEYWRTWNQLGGVLARSGDNAGARTAFQQVIRLMPEKNLGYEQLAAIETKEGNLAAAMAAYEKLPSPEIDGTLASNIGSVYFFAHRLPESRRYYDLALRLAPRKHIVWMNSGDLYTRERKSDSAYAHYREAVRLLEQELHIDPKNVRLRLARAVCLAKAGQCAAAQAALAQIAASLPADNADHAHDTAKLNALCGARAGALDAIRRAVMLGVSPRLLREEDEFRTLARDPQFLALTETKNR